MHMEKECPFCTVPPARIFLEDAAFIALLDGYPVVEGHMLVIPKKHVQSVFDLNDIEQEQLWRFVAAVRVRLNQELNVTAFNIGINDGTAAGQTVPHAHVHIIPRRNGDVDDPRGGIRWVIPAKAKYW
jgi:diadenosine tetraphosphate (Ap4A) HIT family hydrolase